MASRSSNSKSPSMKWFVYGAVVMLTIYVMYPSDILVTLAPESDVAPTATTAVVIKKDTDNKKNKGDTTTTHQTEASDLEVDTPSVLNSKAPSPVAVNTTSNSRGIPSRYRNSKDRMLLPLLLTHICYHGTSLLATTIKGWIMHLLEPQGNIDLVLYYTKPQDREEIIKLLNLKPTQPDPFLESLPVIHQVPDQIFEDGDFQPLSIPLDLLRRENVSMKCGGGGENEKKYGWWNNWKNQAGDVQKDGGQPEWFLTPHSSEIKVRLQLTKLSFPPYIHADPLLLKNESWMRCGCPPFCPAKRAGIDYVQGTRWYTYDLMRQPLMQKYKYWMKLDVDIWFYRGLKFNFVQDMLDAESALMKKKYPDAATVKKEEEAGDNQQERDERENQVAGSKDAPVPVPVFMHTGKKYNGAGCSTNLHQALLTYAAERNMTIPAKGKRWWTDDDDTYYSNFVVSQSEFHMSRRYLEMAKYLNNYPRGFFKHRWTDQSLFHKVYGMFFGPNEEDFVINRSELRCVKKGSPLLPNAVFWHSKRHWPKKELKRCM